GDTDPRPALGSGYRPVSPVAPRSPAVPTHAPAALHITPLTARPLAPVLHRTVTDTTTRLPAG
ncbi:MAG TPA: hypothetical protein VGP04_07875, partial [Pseudonocardiaceae bacterium]|nr:hypothetical protein [Pseudonocardiaceae bacterium]